MVICKSKFFLCAHVPVPLMQAYSHCNNQEHCLWMKRFFQNYQRPQGLRASALFTIFFLPSLQFRQGQKGEKPLHLGPLTMQACQPSIEPPPSGKWEVVPENIQYLYHRWLLGILQERGFFELEMQMHGG